MVVINDIKAAFTPIVNENQILEEKERLGAIIFDDMMYKGKKLVYLTFDDGPSVYTNEILDMLNEYDIKATFFVQAKDEHKDEYQRILEEGHTLALHSYTHWCNKIYESPECFRQDVKKLSDYLYEITGCRCKFYRFPGGSANQFVKFNKNECFDILEEEGLCYFDWNVSSRDASDYPLSASAIAENVLKGVSQQQSSIVLLHDALNKYTTVQALREIIENLLAEGNTVFLPITDGTLPVRFVERKGNSKE